MKKFTLLAFLIGFAYHLNAQSCDQSLPVAVDFSNPNIIPVCWNIIDNDGDGHNWSVSDVGGGNNGLQSASWTPATGPLRPDNWVITNAINLTGGNITLSWRVITPDWSFDKENYAIYVATGNKISNFTSSPVMFTENLDNSNASGRWASRSFDISALAGQVVYIAFRHYNVTDQNVIDIDDVTVQSGTLGVEDFNKDNFKYYYSTNDKTLTLKSSNLPIDSVKIYNILGQNAIDKKLSNTSEAIDLSELADGLYIAQVEINNSTKAIKFLKQ